MKVRRSFVTNSSSSSYVCCYCCNVESGYDLSIEDAGMYECENGHTLCRHHFDEISPKDLYEYYREYIVEKMHSHHRADFDFDRKTASMRAWAIIHDRENLAEIDEAFEKGKIEEFVQETFEFDYNVPSKFCPVCNFKLLTDYDGFKYLLRKTGYDHRIILEEIKMNFKTYEEFQKYSYES